MAKRLGQPAGALAVCMTIALAVAAVSLAQPGRRWLGVAIALALAWGSAPCLLALATRKQRPGSTARGDRASTDPERDDDPGDRTFTTFVRLGDEPVEIARSTVALARRAGPTVIVSDERELPEELTAEADRIHRRGTVNEAMREAAESTDTDAVLIVSARAVPDRDACMQAAALLDDETGWVLGTSRPFNRDRYASDHRELLDSVLRRRAGGHGVDLWENDATLVRTDLLASHQIEPGRVWGEWLRDRRAEGFHGRQVDESLSVRAAPVAADGYWPDALARQRGAAVDAVGAASRGPLRSRSLAMLLLARELYAYPLMVWLLLPALMGPTPVFGQATFAFAMAVIATVGLRWWSLRAMCGVRPSARADVLAAVYHAPGSLAALGAVARRRITPLRTRGSSRPLVWAALALTAVAALGLIRNEPGRSASRLAAGLSLVMLAALWAFTVRSLVERNWSRTSYRIRLARPATVDGVEATTVDGSPGGVAVSGRFHPDAFPVGAEVTVRLDLDDGEVVEVPAVIAARRRRRGGDLLGLELHTGSAALDPWSAQLLRAAEDPSTGPSSSVALDRGSARSPAAAILDRLVVSAVVVVSLAVAAALVLVLLGFRPLVVRSGSMIPTYQVGDIVLVEQIPARELRDADVVSLEYFPEFGESMTHRVRSARVLPQGVQVETRGDANETSEHWSVPADAYVGRVVAHIPALGAPATMVRNAAGPATLAVVIVALIVALVLRGQRTARPSLGPSPDADDTHDPDDQGSDAHGPGAHGPAGQGTASEVL